MNLNCNLSLGDRLKRNTQRARVITEAWFGAEGYCLNCSSLRLTQTTAGTAFCDYVCPKCAQRYELKSARQAHTRVVQDGGFDSMMRQMKAANVPALMLLQYDASWCVRRLLALHPVFLTPDIVRRRPKPHLRPKTGQEYWMCDLDITRIPPDGKIALVQDGAVRPIAEARRAFRESKRFAEVSLKRRGWTALVLTYVRKIGKPVFTLEDIYVYEAEMHAAYPENAHVRDKIRQQLQVLRDLGYLEFVGRGEYRVLI